jgi:hypothetical protein
MECLSPNILHEEPLHLLKVGVWCGVSCWCIMNPVCRRTINSKHYQQLMKQFISVLQVKFWDCWIQQDAVTFHTTVSTMHMLQEFFGDRIISICVWPPRHPSLITWILCVHKLTRTSENSSKILKYALEITQATPCSVASSKSFYSDLHPSRYTLPQTSQNHLMTFLTMKTSWERRFACINTHKIYYIQILYTAGGRRVLKLYIFYIYFIFVPL